MVNQLFLQVVALALLFANISSIFKEAQILINGDYSGTITLPKLANESFIYSLGMNSKNYTYLFKSNVSIEGLITYQDKEGGELIDCPRICVLRRGTFKLIYINKNHNNAEGVKITIESGLYQEKINSIKLEGDYEENRIFLLPQNTLRIFESKVDYVAFFDTEYKAIDIQCLYYQEKITLDDIMKVNPLYFKEDCRGVNKIKENEVFIVQMEIRTNIKTVKSLIQPLNLVSEIKINKKDETWDNFIYLPKKDDKYIIDFANNKRKIALQLSRFTLNTNTTIKESNSEEEEKRLNINNIYYYFNAPNFKGKLEIKVENDDALIEFMSQPDSMDSVDIVECGDKLNKHNITKELTVLKLIGLRTDVSSLIQIDSKNASRSTYVSGFTKNDSYFHLSSDNTIDKYTTYTTMKQQESYIPKANLEDGEFFYILFISDKTEVENYQITLSFTYRLILEDLEEEYTQEQCEYVKGNITEMIRNIYPYEDISKNPPNQEYFTPANVIKELENVETRNRKYYEFFREIRGIITKLRDGNIRVFIARTPRKSIDLSAIVFLSQVNFKIEDGKVHVFLVDRSARKFSLHSERILLSNLNNPVTTINEENPFDFIQNYGFRYLHNAHGYFSDQMNNLYRYSPMYHPLFDNETTFYVNFSETNLNISAKYHFNNEDSYTTSPNPLQQDSSQQESASVQTNQLKETGLTWDLITKDESFACRVDHIKKVNVFKQTAFTSQNPQKYEEIIYSCFERFYNNDYPIIGIESNNNNGDAKFALIFQQLLQIKISNKQYFSAKYTDFMKNYLNRKLDEIINPATCEKFNSIDEISMKEDDYGNNTKHKRTTEFMLRDKTIIKKLETKRKEYLNKANNVKAPTKIVIFTDANSLNAASILIKGLQETGGAIIVGYNGNPFNNEVFEGSQSTTTISNLNDTYYYNNLKRLGFIIGGFPLFESFNYSYQSDNVIPREYTIEPVDERVDLYYTYDDSLYDKFIEKGKKIINDYNNNNKCNPNNTRLLLDSQKCYNINGKEHAHGGFKCGDNGNWTNVCQAYYCDLGYYYDNYQNKCIQDVCLIENSSGDDTTDGDGNKNLEEKFPTYAIVIIIVGSVLVVLVVVFFVYRFIKKKNIPSENNYNELK